MTAADATRLAGETYRTRLARGEAAAPDDKTRLAQEGYRSRLARDAAPGQPDASEFYKVGEKIGGRYEVSAIHRGELGVVYGCFDHQTKLPRALKTVPARHEGDKQVLSLFESEAAVWISLEKHPYIVRAYLVERFKDLPYVITEYIRGPEGMEGDLRGWLGHPRLTLPVAVAMALQIAQGMQHAVRKVPSLVHRDLKPANILVNGDGKAMVTDFGLVLAAQSGAGTPAYMSPEQWRAEALDTRSDIYAYGCILFEMFTAHRLFPALTERDWERAHLESSPAVLTTIVPDLPGEIDRFVRRCIAKDMATRPPNWDEIVTFLAQWYHSLTGKAVVLDFTAIALDAGEWLDASYSFLKIDRPQEALLACDQALANDSNMAAAWGNKAVALHYFLQRYEEAIFALDQALILDPDNAKRWINKGAALDQLKRHQESLAAYDQALIIDPDNAKGWFSKGFALFSLKREEEALAAYSHAIALDANTVYPWDAMGLLLQLTTMSAGKTVKGLVKNITDHGAFVDLGGIDGVLHITDLAWRRVKHPSEVLAVGDEVTAKVLKFDTEKNRVSLGLKQLGEDPWVGVGRRYPTGTRLFGEVTYLTDYGSFVEVESGIEGLVHVSEMDWTNKNVHPSKVVQLGDEVEVMILEIDEDRRRISLGMKQCMPNPWEEFSANFKKGDKVRGQIKSITDVGIFIDLPGSIDGLVHLSDLSWTLTGEEAVRNFRKAEEIEAMVLSIDVERERISLGIKQIEGDPFNSFVATNEKGTRVDGTVKSIDAKGAVVTLTAEVEGYLRASQISRDRVEDARTHLKEGDAVNVMIINVDRKNRIINLSVKPKDVADEVEAMAKLQSESAARTGSPNLRALPKEKLGNKSTQPRSFWDRFRGK